jgi:hypothetical protein
LADRLCCHATEGALQAVLGLDQPTRLDAIVW